MHCFLRSKRERALLWYAQDGRCALCGEALPERWHADHTVPWWFSRRTNVFEMGATCPRCNQQKGGKMQRLFQVELRDMVERLLSGEPMPKAIFADVTPGGGRVRWRAYSVCLFPKWHRNSAGGPAQSAHASGG